jgi:hypothetical protein
MQNATLHADLLCLRASTARGGGLTGVVPFCAFEKPAPVNAQQSDQLLRFIER